jgi:hypothetical protein
MSRSFYMLEVGRQLKRLGNTALNHLINVPTMFGTLFMRDPVHSLSHVAAENIYTSS